MKRFRTSLLLMASFLAFSALGFSSATDVYITPDGSSQGVCTTSPHNPAWFNSSANWGSGISQIGPGTTVHLCGTITTELSFHGGGTSGNLLTLLFESGASVQISPGADSAGAIGLNGNSYIVIDGGVNQPCGWNTATNASEGACNGKIENMLYGSSNGVCPGGACTTQASSSKGWLILSSGGSNIEVRNIELGPSYIHTASGAGLADNNGTEGILLTNVSNVNFHDSKCHDAVWCVVFVYSSGTITNWNVANNEMFNNSHMMAFGGAGSTTLNGATISGNYTHDMSNWDTTSDANHANAIHSYGVAAGSTQTNLTINNNIFGGHMGADVTAQIYIEGNSSAATNINIFNNLLYNSDSTSTAPERLLFQNVCTSGCLVLNNTILGPKLGFGWGIEFGYNGASNTTTIARYENNAVATTNYLVDAQHTAFGTANYNVYGPFGAGWDWAGSIISSFPTWKSGSSEGSNSTYNSGGINLAADYHPNAGSPVIGAGTNLTSLCSGNVTALCSDLAGVARPASGAWDSGAYQYAAGDPPPTGMSAVVH